MEEAGNALLLLVPFVQVATRDQETFRCVWFWWPHNNGADENKKQIIKNKRSK